MAIEWWFKKGARFRWTAPNDLPGPRDGSILPSPPTASVMTFDGVEEALLPAVHPMEWTRYTYKSAVQHTWLCYQPGHTAEVNVVGDVLTGFMSGCLIVQYLENGQRKVAHVGTTSDVAKDKPPNTTVKQNFLNKLNGLSALEKPHISGYNPANAWMPEEIGPLQSKLKDGNYRIASLTTSSGVFYSLLLLRASKWPTIWTSGGIKQIGGFNLAQLTDALS